MKRIIVEMRDGLVSAVYVDGKEAVKVSVIDYDFLDDPFITEEDEQDFYQLQEETKSLNCVW